MKKLSPLVLLLTLFSTSAFALPTCYESKEVALQEFSLPQRICFKRFEIVSYDERQEEGVLAITSDLKAIQTESKIFGAPDGFGNTNLWADIGQITIHEGSYAHLKIAQLRLAFDSADVVTSLDRPRFIVDIYETTEDSNASKLLMGSISFKLAPDTLP